MNPHAASAVAAGSRMPDARNLNGSVRPRSAAATIPRPPALDLPLSPQSTIQNPKSEIPAPLTPRRPMAAFSLTEVVIALGIFAVSMVGILALFPVASSAGRESSEETQASILAETIFSDLRTSTLAKGKSAGWIVRGPNTFTNTQWIRPISLTNSATYFIGYDLISRTNSSGPDGVGMIGNPIALKAITTVLSSSSYSNAISAAGAVFGSQVAIEPVASLPGLAIVRVTIDAPVSVTSTNRRTYEFASLLSAP